MTVGGTDAYSGLDDLPPLVRRAVEVAREQQFDLSCRPQQGRLLCVLAAGRPGGVIGETGTGCGVGLAWLATGADPGAALFSVERDADRADAARSLFKECPNVTVLTGDWTDILAHGPFDLLVLDGGGSGKTLDDTPVDPETALASFGTLVIDDFTPLTRWPPEYDGTPDRVRLHWLQHPALLATEIVVCPEMSTIVATRQ